MLIGLYSMLLAIFAWFINGASLRVVSEISQRTLLESSRMEFFLSRWDFLKSAWQPLLVLPVLFAWYLSWPLLTEIGLGLFAFGIILIFFKQRFKVLQGVSVFFRALGMILFVMMLLIRELAAHRNLPEAAELFFFLSDIRLASLWTLFVFSAVISAYLRTEVYALSLMFVLFITSMVSTPVALMMLLGARSGVCLIFFIKSSKYLRLGPLCSFILLLPAAIYVRPIAATLGLGVASNPLDRLESLGLFAALLLLTEMLLRSIVYHVVFTMQSDRLKSVESDR